MEDPLGLDALDQAIDHGALQQIEAMAANAGGELGRWRGLRASDRSVDDLALPVQQLGEVAPGKAVHAGDENDPLPRFPWNWTRLLAGSLRWVA